MGGLWEPSRTFQFRAKQAAGVRGVTFQVPSPGPRLVFFYPLPCSMLGLLLPVGARGSDSAPSSCSAESEPSWFSGTPG